MRKPTTRPITMITMDPVLAGQACKDLVTAYNHGERDGGSMDLQEVSDALLVAMQACPGAYAAFKTPAVQQGRRSVMTMAAITDAPASAASSGLGVPDDYGTLGAAVLRIINAHVVDGEGSLSWEELDLAHELALVYLGGRGLDVGSLGLEDEPAAPAP